MPTENGVTNIQKKRSVLIASQCLAVAELWLCAWGKAAWWEELMP